MRRSVVMGAAIVGLIGILGIVAVHQAIIAFGWGGHEGVELGVPKDAGPPKPFARAEQISPKGLVIRKTATPAQPPTPKN